MFHIRLFDPIPHTTDLSRFRVTNGHSTYLSCDANRTTISFLIAATLDFAAAVLELAPHGRGFCLPRAKIGTKQQLPKVHSELALSHYPANEIINEALQRHCLKATAIKNKTPQFKKCLYAKTKRP